MDKIDTAFRALPRAPDDLHQRVQDTPAKYMPGEFLKEAGIIIAVSLGLAMLAQVVVMIVGEY